MIFKRYVRYWSYLACMVYRLYFDLKAFMVMYCYILFTALHRLNTQNEYDHSPFITNKRLWLYDPHNEFVVV